MTDVSIVVETVFFDFVHVNPHRTHENAVEIMVFFPIPFGILAMFVSFLIFTIPQFFQAVLIFFCGRKCYALKLIF
jgi:hypothetical protein